MKFRNKREKKITFKDKNNWIELKKDGYYDLAGNYIECSNLQNYNDNSVFYKLPEMVFCKKEDIKPSPSYPSFHDDEGN